MRAMPQTLSLFKRHGVSFSNGHVTTPLCCPARASMFSGLYAHNHGILTNNPSGPVRHDLPVAEHLSGEAPGGRLPHRAVRQVPEQLGQGGRRQGRLRQVQGRLQGHRARPCRARARRPDHRQARQPVHQGPRIRRRPALDDDPGDAIPAYATRAGQALRERRRAWVPAADLIQRVGPLRQAALPARRSATTRHWAT